MNLTEDIAHLSAKLLTRGPKARIVMVAPVTPGAGASSVAASLAHNATHQSGRPAWLYDLDFAKNNQAKHLKVQGPDYTADFGALKCWRVQPETAQARLVLRRSAYAPIFVSQFHYQPRTIRQLDFLPDPAYWDKVREACGLVILDAPSRLQGKTTLAQSFDGVILVADGRRSTQDSIDAMAVNFEDQGAQVYGVIINRAAAGQVGAATDHAA